MLSASLLAGGADCAWKAKWISKQYSSHETNTWLAFRKTCELGAIPQSVTASIAADTKYWMWINGEMVVREGGLKRGPAPGDGYFDQVEIAPYLHEGRNVISILVWYFGRSGFSHMSSGIPALLFQAEGEGVEILSDGSWEGTQHLGFQTASCPAPNFRLPESSVRFDARMFNPTWYKADNGKTLGGVIELGIAPGQAPLGKLVKRPIPLWKDYGLKAYEGTIQRGDTLCCRLPYNCHVTPWLKVKAPAGKLIRIQTDHDFVTTVHCVRAEYVTRAGEQEFECYGWMNGEEVQYILPQGVEVVDVKYRESGFDTDFTGYFRCDDEFLNEYVRKASRTLYVCMRDTYYDCPDRERAQWWGDEVNELAEAFCLLSPSSASLALKGIRELAAWQRPDGVLHAPVPVSNYFKELPIQMLASVGWYGFHDFYWYSGDDSFVADVYPAVHRYLHEVWQVDEQGMPIYRKGDWDWPDAGENCDREALLPCWYQLALKAELEFAKMLGKTDDAACISAMMDRIQATYDSRYWRGSEYMTEGFEGEPDDRVNAMAVVAGLAPAERWPQIVEVLRKSFFATTYMQRYVLEALCIMGEPSLALDRMKKLYPTIMKPECSTLYEHFNFDGTCNHAWTGGGAIVLSRQIAGITPLEPAFRRFQVAPQMGWLKTIEAAVDTHYGLIEVSLQRMRAGRIRLDVKVPEGTEALVPMSKGEPVVLGPGSHQIIIK